MHGKSNSYFAYDTNLMGALIDPNDYRQIVMAIDAATRRTIDQRTTINCGLQTRALIIC
jgi:hypothetical protein